MPHPSTLPIDDLLKSCQIRRQRRSGPGGQHRNKVETGVFIEHLPTGVRAEATEGRSQARNQTQAIFRLRMNLAIEHRSPESAEGPLQLSDCWRSRVRKGQIQVNPEHDDFPAMIAEAMDALACCQWEPKVAKEMLKCSASQLIKLLKKQPRACSCLNRMRAERGLGPLH